MFVGAMVVMVGLVFLIVDHGFKSNLLRACSDDLQSIRVAYATAKPGRAVHEATEMIEDRTLASDAQDKFLLQFGPSRKVAGNIGTMAPVLGVVHLRLPSALAAKPWDEVLGRGEFIGPGVYAFVGRDLTGLRGSELQIFAAFAGVLAVSVILACLSAMWLSGLYLRRIDAISDTCRAIMAGDLDERVSTNGAGGELERLAATVNGMLDRIQALMESVRQVSDDIAHDLRTPLAHLRSGLEKAASEERSPPGYRRAVLQAIGEADQLLEMFAALLRIARIESRARIEAFQPFDLGQVLAQAFSMYAPLMEDEAHPAAMLAVPGTIVFGDRQLVLQIVANLLDNAVHHTPPGTRVTGWAGLRDGCPTLVIADTGAGIPSADRERVLRRFVRLEKSRTSAGHGLGLSTVAAIVGLHDAHVALEDNGPGLRVSVQFPPYASAEARGHRRALQAPLPAEA
jgi:signal transduction histidine kinase